MIGALLLGCACSSSVTDGRGTVSSSSPTSVPATSAPSSTGSTTPVPVPSGGGTSIGPSNAQDPYTRPELAAARAIPGMIYRAEPDHTHVDGVVQYDAAPPVGGNHSAYWADCDGAVYPEAIADENAVHALEHGSVWITYRPGLPADQVDRLAALVRGRDHMLMSPYPDLRTAISLQSWDYQLFVDDASDPRIEQFAALLRNNPQTAPELNGECAQPTFLQHPSTFGHPLSAPA